MDKNADAVEVFKDTLEFLGHDLTDENFIDTPKRWVKMMEHFHVPYDPAKDLGVSFSDPGSVAANVPETFKHGMVVQTNIPFRAMCAHHLLPFVGVAHVGYVPDKFVVGLSKLARVVYGMSHQTPSLQEHIGQGVVDAIDEHLHTHGVMCVISATHGCMECRGVEEHGVTTTTSHVRGVFMTKMDARNEFLQIVQMTGKS